MASVDFALTAQLLIVLCSCKWGSQVVTSYFGILYWQWGDLPHLLESGNIVKLLLRAYGSLNFCSLTFSRLFNLTVLLLAQDKMENPCGGGLSEQSTHSQEYGISLQIPSAHFRYDPINLRICALPFHLLPNQQMIRILNKASAGTFYTNFSENISS